MYLLSCLVVFALVMFSTIRIMMEVSGFPLFRIFLPMLLVFLMSSPLFASFFIDEGQLHSGQPIMLSTGEVSVVLSLMGSAGVLVLIVRDFVMFWDIRPGLGFWGTGKCLALTIASGIGVVATTSHLMFTHGEHAGTVAFDAFRDAAPDIECDASVLLFRWNGERDSPVEYRCPTVYLLNRHASKPFLPWPDYRAGQSADLAVALHDMMGNSDKKLR